MCWSPMRLLVVVVAAFVQEVVGSMSVVAAVTAFVAADAAVVAADAAVVAAGAAFVAASFAAVFVEPVCVDDSLAVDGKFVARCHWR